MRCLNCNKEVSYNDTFCQYCGSKIVKELECTNCHQIIPIVDNYCMFCGTKNSNYVKIDPISINDRNIQTNTNDNSKLDNKYIILFIIIGILLVALIAVLINGSNSNKESAININNEIVTAKQDETQEIITKEENKEKKIIINARMRIRSLPSTTGEIVGYAEEGYTYTYTDTTNNEGYTWYNVGYNMWIASNGQWVSEIN